MRLALDATYALDPLPSGVARYSERLIRELAAQPEVHLTLCARWPRFLRLAGHFTGVRFRPCWLQEPFNLLLPRRADLFHGLNQRLPRYSFRRQLITVHDVFALSGESYSTPAFRARFSAMLRDAVTRADRIVCVSAYTRDQLCRVLAVPPERCVVIHHGVDPPSGEIAEEARREARARAGPGPFLLTVGAVQVRKNTLAAVDAIARVPESTGLRLVVAGGAGHGAERVWDEVRRRRLEQRVRFLGYLAEPLLEALYAEATALLFPSLEEGFGFPVLEALARGLPVIAAHTSSLPEIAGDAAILVDPHDSEAMASHAIRLLEDEAWRAEWAVRGRIRARSFTWERAARKTLAVYRALL